MKWITILFGLFIILIVILADLGKLGVLSPVNSIPYGDKAGHFLLYGILALLLNLTFIRSRPDSNPNWIVLRIAWILALLVGLEEVSQQFFASRTFSLIDLGASYLGVFVFSWLALRIKTEGRG